MCADFRPVSIIIPTKESSRTIGRTLESINRQTYRNIEIIVVDSFSKDSTMAIASSLCAKIFQTPGERTRAKNVGAFHASGYYLLFIDSDMILERTVVDDCVRKCESEVNRGVIIPERSVGSRYWTKVRDFERTFYNETLIESPRFFLRSDVIEVGGFDEDVIIYEEATLPYRLEKRGLKIRNRINSYILHDEENFNLRDWLTKKRYYQQTRFVYEGKYRSYSESQLKPSYRAKLYLRNWRRIIRYPLLSCGLVVLKGLEYASYMKPIS